MTKRDQQTYALAGVIILIVAGIWLFRTKSTKNEVGEKNTQNQQTTEQNQPVTSSNSQSQAASTWTGTLKVSDTKVKGNLMLVTADHTVYLRTSRDFSSLVGKEVVVSYTGSLENFSLNNIVAK